MAEKIKNNFNNILIFIITLMVGLVSFIYVRDTTANEEFKKTESKALNELVNQMIELKTANYHEHEAIAKSIYDHECWSEDIRLNQIEPNTKWRVEGEPRLLRVEKKVGIY